MKNHFENKDKQNHFENKDKHNKKKIEKMDKLWNFIKRKKTI